MHAATHEYNFSYRLARYNIWFDLVETLVSNGYYKVAIYGGAVTGLLLYETLYDSPVKVEYIVDRNKNLNFPFNVKLIEPNDIGTQNYVDAILITPVGKDSKIISMLNNFSPKIGTYISIDNLLIDFEDYLLFREVNEYLSSQKTRLLLMDLSNPLLHENPSTYECLSQIHDTSYNNLYYNYDVIKNYYDDLKESSRNYVNEVFSFNHHPLLHIIENNGIKHINDMRSDYFNVVNKCRITTDAPDKFDSTIHFFGNCASIGAFAEDKYTIESHLQRKLLSSPIDNKVYKVENRSSWREFRDSLKQILDCSYSEEDIIILITMGLERFKLHFSNLSYYDLTSAFNRPHKYGDKEIFFDNYHMNHRGYDLLADKIYSILCKEIRHKSKQVTGKFNIKINKQHLIQNKNSPELLIGNYLTYLNKEKVNINGVIGAIVVNCNPFSLGHQYLIEKALKVCDYLYVFVIEEDKSFFSFEDRITMVKMGVANLSNVKILRSGQFIISSLTFPEYFNKDSVKTSIDASYDLEIFAKNVCPVLHISKRFVGEEPICNVTRQYNNAMKEILPQYGIDVIVFPRIEFDEKPISASLIRSLLMEKRYDKISKLVPGTTFTYLMNLVKTNDIFKG